MFRRLIYKLFQKGKDPFWDDLMNEDDDDENDENDEMSAVKKKILEIIKVVNPKNYSEIFKVVGMAMGDGTWENNAEELLEDGVASLSELISCKEDVENYLMDIGLSVEFAQKVAKYTSIGFINKGKFYVDRYEIMEEYDVSIPTWFLFSLSRIKKLPNKDEIQDCMYRLLIDGIVI